MRKPDSGQTKLQVSSGDRHHCPLFGELVGNRWRRVGLGLFYLPQPSISKRQYVYIWSAELYGQVPPHELPFVLSS